LAVDVLLVRHAGDLSYGRQIQTRYVATPRTSDVSSQAVTIFEVPFQGALETALELMKQRRPDVIHIHPVELWPLAHAIHGAIETPIVYTVHSLNLCEYKIGHEPPEILNLWHMQQALIADASRVVVLTEDERELLLDTCPEARDRVRIVGNGVMDNEHAQQVVHRGRSNASPIVLYAGRFVDRKGIHELFAAIPRVLEYAPDTRFVFVGGYGSGADVERAWLPESLSVFRNCIHFTGWLAPSDVAQWYALADVLVVPSWYEPFGMVVLEGMLYGLAIAASDVGGPAAILDDGRTGMLFPPKQVNAIADRLIRLVTNSALRSRLGESAAHEVRAKWLWPHVAGKMRAVYEELLGSCASPSSTSPPTAM
jgi:glycogen(starch) synthase